MEVVQVGLGQAVSWLMWGPTNPLPQGTGASAKKSLHFHPEPGLSLTGPGKEEWPPSTFLCGEQRLQEARQLGCTHGEPCRESLMLAL